MKLTDNGPGFSEKIIDRVFDPYFTTKARGTGLGLAIVKKIIEEHGGLVGIRNMQVGAMTEVSLPVRDKMELKKQQT